MNTLRDRLDRERWERHQASKQTTHGEPTCTCDRSKRAGILMRVWSCSDGGYLYHSEGCPVLDEPTGSGV